MVKEQEAKLQEQREFSKEVCRWVKEGDERANPYIVLFDRYIELDLIRLRSIQTPEQKQEQDRINGELRDAFGDRSPEVYGTILLKREVQPNPSAPRHNFRAKCMC